jgi:hypothetical protein
LFDRTCIAKHQTPPIFPPRNRLSGVNNNKDSSEEENEDALDDNYDVEEESIVLDGGTSTRSEYVDESETGLQKRKTVWLVMTKMLDQSVVT